MNIKTEITKLHYDKNTKGPLFQVLRLASLFYSVGADLKNLFYDKGLIKPKKVDAFVISIGNFTTGGVGKTPVVAELAKYFVDKGERVAIVSRGYGGKLNNKNVNVISDGINLYYKADMAGDEPYWLAVNLNMCAVLTCSNRYKACQYAIKTLGATKIILDDGFQHRKLHRDLNLVLVDSEKMFGNENLLPAGPLREKPDFTRVDKLLMISKNIDHSKSEKAARIIQKKQGVETLLVRVEPDYIYNIVTGEHLENGSEITAISAIGQPEQFYRFLEPNYKINNKITFDDHHQYSIDDIKDINSNIVTTEKDAVKLALLGKTNIYALKLKTVLDVEQVIN